ncbi:MAG: DNA-deoxyinosine glycosylase [Treponema sp.]|nr:DNA-deoxyinosine glycosylase [Treponema sp.]
MLTHPIAPVYDGRSRILILGSFPSARSRETGFFYGHPQNRFWKLLAFLYGQNIPANIEEKRAFLLSNRIALWDVIASCEIEGSSDASISAVTANDLSPLLQAASIEKIFTNGKKADALYSKYIYPQTQRQTICLPSTSPANASWTFEKLCMAWEIILH